MLPLNISSLCFSKIYIWKSAVSLKGYFLVKLFRNASLPQIQKGLTLFHIFHLIFAGVCFNFLLISLVHFHAMGYKYETWDQGCRSVRIRIQRFRIRRFRTSESHIFKKNQTFNFCVIFSPLNCSSEGSVLLPRKNSKI